MPVVHRWRRPKVVEMKRPWRMSGVAVVSLKPMLRKSSLEKTLIEQGLAVG